MEIEEIHAILKNNKIKSYRLFELRELDIIMILTSRKNLEKAYNLLNEKTKGGILIVQEDFIDKFKRKRHIIV